LILYISLLFCWFTCGVFIISPSPTECRREFPSKSKRTCLWYRGKLEQLVSWQRRVRRTDDRQQRPRLRDTHQRRVSEILSLSITHSKYKKLNSFLRLVLSDKNGDGHKTKQPFGQSLSFGLVSEEETNLVHDVDEKNEDYPLFINENTDVNGELVEDESTNQFIVPKPSYSKDSSDWEMPTPSQNKYNTPKPSKKNGGNFISLPQTSVEGYGRNLNSEADAENTMEDIPQDGMKSTDDDTHDLFKNDELEVC